MQISGISKVAPSTSGRLPAPPQPKAAIPSSSATVPQPEPAASFTSSASGSPIPVAASTSAPASARVSAYSVENQSSVTSSQAAALTTSYSTTVAGKNYSGSVQESEGTYVASIPNPPGASASGSSVQSAENNLDVILDTLA